MIPIVVVFNEIYIIDARRREETPTMPFNQVCHHTLWLSKELVITTMTMDTAGQIARRVVEWTNMMHSSPSGAQSETQPHLPKDHLRKKGQKEKGIPLALPSFGRGRRKRKCIAKKKSESLPVGGVEANK